MSPFIRPLSYFSAERQKGSTNTALICFKYIVINALLQRIAAHWIDPDTPNKYHHMVHPLGADNNYELIMSSGKKSLHFYNDSYAYTKEGVLIISTTDEKTSWRGWVCSPYLS